MKYWILGITGGVGCGKSAVLDILEKEYGAYVIQADIVAHELMEPGQASYLGIVEHFGQEILAADGRIDRKALGTIVFGDEKKLALLNSLTHPAVKEEIRSRIAQLLYARIDEKLFKGFSPSDSSNGAAEETVHHDVFIVIEAALLLEDHYDEICDEIWYIYADQEVRFERLARSRGYSREKSQSMMDNQMSEAELRQRCQAVIDNSGTLAETSAQLRQMLEARSPLFLGTYGRNCDGTQEIST